MSQHDEISRRTFLGQTLQLGAAVTLLDACGRVRPTVAPSSQARFSSAGDQFTLANDDIAATWRVQSGAFRPMGIAAAGAGNIDDNEAFVLTLADGSPLEASAMRVVAGPHEEPITPHPSAARLAERLGGKQIIVTLEDAGRGLRATWRGELRDGSRYLRQELTLEATREPVPIREIALWDLTMPGAAVNGAVRGSPIVADNWYFAFEHPLSNSSVDGQRARALLARELPLRPGAPLVVSSVIGIARPYQLRRDFLAYVERERAHPYRTFLHYNSWYDIGYFSKYNEADALAVIAAFGQELVAKRGVTLNGFLFDDGWDDPRTLWGFHAGFPNGFTPVRQAAERYGAEPGVWLSPWGGYGKPKADRIANGQAQGFETNKGGFALSGPKYYERFRDTCLKMIREYGVNQFKIDGTGNVTNAVPGSAFDSDFDAAIHLIGELRAEKPDLYINLTTGTYPSPFWLRYADSIWRGGEDHSFAGVGSDRQQWITYRDGDTFRGVVSRGPLFPLNALMLHGLIYAKQANKLMTDPGGDFPSEIRAYFGTGTQLQEMYVTPSLLSSHDWDVLAEAAKWSRRNADILVDTHWIGGDPRHLDVYGHAAWSSRGGVLSLRNPNDKPQSIAIDLAKALELPPGAATRYTARSPWVEDRDKPLVTLDAGKEHEFRLAPFEVLTLDLSESQH